MPINFFPSENYTKIILWWKLGYKHLFKKNSWLLLNISKNKDENKFSQGIVVLYNLEHYA